MRLLAPTLLAGTLAACAPLPSDAPDWPTLGEGPQLAADTVITHFAFGSCNGQGDPQGVWNTIAGSHPQAFIAMGDNVYGDIGYDGGPGLDSFVAAYRQQMISAPFMGLRRDVPMLVTWDDHDFGSNDGGGTFAHRAASEQLFEYFWHLPDEAREHAGVYHSVTVGPRGRRVQFIVLDTRYFRSDLVRLPQESDRGRYTANLSPDATVLGAEQWDWLARELAEPADLRVVVSSIQVLSQVHGWEAWDRLPLERARLLDLLADRAGGGLVILSGDRHAAGIYETEWNGQPLVEFTSSSLNRPMTGGTARATEREPDPMRVTPFVGEANFGSMAIDWSRRELAMAIVAADGTPIETLVRGF